MSDTTGHDSSTSIPPPAAEGSSTEYEIQQSGVALDQSWGDGSAPSMPSVDDDV